MKRTATTYLTTLVAFMATDAVWLTLVAGPQYKASIGPLLEDQPRLGVALAFYLIQAAGMIVFVTPRAIGRSLGWAALFGALFGLFTYCTFDLTDFTVLRGWTLYLTVTDVAWGIVLSAWAAFVGEAAARRILGVR